MEIFNDPSVGVELESFFLSVYDKPEAALFLFDVVSNFNTNIKKDLIKPILERRSEYKLIPKEVRWNYWKSWALSDFPEKGLLFLREVEWLQEFPELFVLLNLPQNPKTHPEGDVFTHSHMAVSQAVSIAKRNMLSDEDRVVLIFSALCHDMGKSEGGDGHEVSGESISLKFLFSVGAPFDVIQKVTKMVRFHMADYINSGKLIKKIDITKKYVSNVVFNLAPASLELLYMLHEADVTGRGDGKVFSDATSENFKKIMAVYKGLHDNIFSYRTILELGATGILPKEIMEYGDHQNSLVKSVNQAFVDEVLKPEEIKTLLSYVFSDDYVEAVDYVLELDYRSFKKLSEYFEKSGADLDTVLLKGKNRLKEILNTSDN